MTNAILSTTDEASRVRVGASDWIAAPIVLDGACVVAIGDVHGRSDLLAPLLEHLDAIAPDEARVVFLGDLVDRGPDSLGCLRLARRSIGARETTWLMGNHEAMMCAGLGLVTDRPSKTIEKWRLNWRVNGGAGVLAELGGPDLSRLGAAEREVLEGLRTSLRIGEVLFVHAGITAHCVIETPEGLVFDEETLAAFLGMHPLDVPLDECHPLWIRNPFLGYFSCFEAGPLVVHGHTPVPRDMKLMRRAYEGAHEIGIEGRHLNLDAGSFAYDEVAAAILKDGFYRIVYASARPVS